MRRRGWVLLGACLLLSPLAIADKVIDRPTSLPVDLVVPRGETYTLQGGARLDGPGDLIVDGRLVVRGTPAAPIVINATVVLGGDGPHVLEHVQFQGVAEALIVNRSARVEGSDVVFLDTGVALNQSGSSSVSLSNATFQGNRVGASVRGNGSFALDDATFRSNQEHVAIDALPGWRGEIRGSTFSAPLAGDHPAILARGAGDSKLILEASRIRDAAVGLRAVGAIAIEGESDQFLGNALALDVSGASVTLSSAIFNDNGLVWRGAPEPTLLEATFGSGAAPAAVTLAETPGEDGRLLTLSLVLGAVAIVGVGSAVVYARRLRATRQQLEADVRAREVPVEDAQRTPPAPGGPPPDLSQPLRPQERRILADIAANPGTPQSAVAERLGLSRQALHYHVKKLEARGLVTKVARGRETHCYVRAGVEGVLAMPVAPQGDEAVT